jgi:hypothetical protein
VNCSGELLRFTAALIAFCLPSAATAQPSCEANAALLVRGLRGGSGSTVGPGGALYVTEAGRFCVSIQKRGRPLRSPPDCRVGSSARAAPWTSRSSEAPPTY